MRPGPRKAQGILPAGGGTGCRNNTRPRRSVPGTRESCQLTASWSHSDSGQRTAITRHSVSILVAILDTNKLRRQGHLVAEYCRVVKPLDRQVVDARG